MGFLAPPGVDPEADVANWVARTDAGEPYDDDTGQAVVRRMARFHSAYYIRPARPAPLFIGSGFTDDLFPVDETLRFANRIAKLYPRSPLSLFLGDFGHQRAANKPEERGALIEGIHDWFDHFLKGRRRAPKPDVTAYVETCPKTDPSIGPFHAGRFADLTRTSVRFDGDEPASVLSTGGDPTVAQAIDPAAGGGDSCVQTDAATAPGTARYTLLEADEHRVTTIGSLKLRAKLAVDGVAPENAELVGRLWDVADGKQTLVARGTYRPHEGRNAWQLHPGAWRFEPGHSAVLELLGQDAPYARPANGVYSIAVKGLHTVMPVR
jgi:hypothetical protein